MTDDPHMLPISLAEYEVLKRKAAALDWLEDNEMEIARLGSGEGALWLTKGQAILDAVEARMKAEGRR